MGRSCAGASALTGWERHLFSPGRSCDKWGAQVRLTDPNGDGRFGLLAAAPGENTGDGHVWVLSAGAGGITASGSWTYNAASLGAPAVDALFGSAIDE